MLNLKLKSVIAGLAFGLTALCAPAQAEGPPEWWPKGATWYEYDKTTPVRPFVGAVTGKWYNNGGHQIFIINGQTLPLQHAIQRIRGNGKRKIAIIADPNCPRARELEKNLSTLDDVTIYTFMVPVLPDTYKESKALSNYIMCQSTNQFRAQGYDAVMTHGMIPSDLDAFNGKPCPAVDEVLASFEYLVDDDLGHRYIDVTPYLFIFHKNNVVYPKSGARPKSSVMRLLPDEK